jgi:putative phosphoesterase
MRIAFVADIHGNAPALEAVLEDIERQNVDEILAVGDFINVAPYSREVLDIIYKKKLRAVIGNHEEYLIRWDVDGSSAFPKAQWGPVHFTASQLNGTDFDYLRNLPEALEVDEDIVMMHGARGNLNRGILPSTPAEKLDEYFGDISQRVIVTGHTHVPVVCYWKDKLIVNPGAVGVPLDRNPDASYAILTKTDHRVMVQHRRVAYDRNIVGQAFHERGLLEQGGIISSLHMQEIMSGQIMVSPFLVRLSAHMQTNNIGDFSQAVAKFSRQAIGPDPTYGMMNWALDSRV